MAFENVPWFVAGGVHSPEVARLLAYAATTGKEGVVGATDLAVKQLAVPGPSIRVMPGACAILNRAPGGGQQTYIARMPDETEVPISPTGSGAGRTDLVIARVEDPQYPGWSEPADPTVGPYVFVRVVEDVAADVTRVQDVSGHESDSAITLARLVIPESTGTIIDAYVTGTRETPPGSTATLRKVFSEQLSASFQRLDVTDVGGEKWPAETNWQLEIPAWATRAKIVARIQNHNVPPGETKGEVWFRLGAVGLVGAVDTAHVNYLTPDATSWQRATATITDDIAIPEAIRGTTVEAMFRGKLISTSDASANLRLDDGSSASADIEFIESPE